MKLYLDDERTTPEGWVRCYTAHECIEILKHMDVTELSLDHDLGDDEAGTGNTVVLWIEERVFLHHAIPPKMKVHSANSSARIKMEGGIRSIDRCYALNLTGLNPQ